MIKKREKNIAIDRNEMKNRMEENICRILRFPKDEQMEGFYSYKDDLKKISEYFEKVADTEYLENASKRMKECLVTFEESLFWLEKNREKFMR